MLWNPTNEEYYADRSCLSFSQLRDFDEYGPEGYRKLYVTGEWKREPTDAMEFGSLIHRVLCDGKPLDDCVTFPPADVLAKNGARSTNAYREWAADVESKGRVIVNDKEYAKAREIVAAVAACPIASHLAQATHQEQAFRWEMHDNLWRAKLDVITPWFVADFKTTTKPMNVRTYERLVYDARYHWQAAIYAKAIDSAGLDPRPFYFVLLEKAEPYRVQVVEIDGYGMAIAREELFGEGGVIEQLDDYMDSNDWRAVERKGVLTIRLPEYAGSKKYHPVEAMIDGQ